MVGLHVLPPAVLAVLAIGKQTGHSERGFAALKSVEQVRIPQLGSALLVQNGQTGVFVVLKGLLDVHTVQDTADEFGLGEVEFFAGQAYAIRSFSSAVTRTLMMCVFRFRGVSLRFSRACAFGLFISAIFDLL